MSSGASRGALVAVVLAAGLLAVGMLGVLGAVFYLTAQHDPPPERQVVSLEAAEPVASARDSGSTEKVPEPTVEPAIEEVEAVEEPPPPGVPPAPPPKKKKKKSQCTPNGKGIKQLGPHKWRVKRSVIERYTSNMKAAERLASVKWAKNKSGKNIGVRLSRVPCKSPLRAAGLRSKDLILTVSGQKVTGVAQGLRVWASVRRDDSFTVKIRRKGGTTVHRYVLVD
jgi:S1-C subfamily serine protease